WLRPLSGRLAVAVIALAIALSPRDRRVWFWLVAFVGTGVTLATGIVGPRLMFLPGVAGFALIAHAAHELWIRGRCARAAPARAFGLAALGVLGLVHLALPLYESPQAHEQIQRFERATQEFARGLPRAAAECGSAVMILNTPNYFVSTFALLSTPNP